MRISLRFGLALIAAAFAALPAIAQGQASDSQRTVMPQIRTGVYRGHIVKYAMIGGKQIMSGDILLDHVSDLADLKNGRTKTLMPNGIGILGGMNLWPKVNGIFTIPYEFTGSDHAEQDATIADFNKIFKGFMRFAPRKKEIDYVEFDVVDPAPTGACDSGVGRSGGPLTVYAMGCSGGLLLHEMGHVVGLYHEQQRSDRDSYVTFNIENVIDGLEYAFAQTGGEDQDIGPYDYASIMHYDAFAFARFGTIGPTLETIPTGIDMGTGAYPNYSTATYSAADIDSIHRLYGDAPKKVTVATNPTGLSVTVDGISYTAPATFDWAIGSKHTIAVPPGGQSFVHDKPGDPVTHYVFNGYVYGRWSDNKAASHTVTVTAGDGTPTHPRNRPATTVYTANFINLFRADPAGNGYPGVAGKGSIRFAPAPQSYRGLPGMYLPQRLPVTFTPVPAGGSTFMHWNYGGDNPLQSTVGHRDVATFGPADKPLTIVDTQPKGIDVSVGGLDITGPYAFAWKPGTKHALALDTYDGGADAQTTFIGWSDGGRPSHIFTATGASRQNVTATFKQRFRPYLPVEPSCAATLPLSPSSDDGFFDPGTQVSISGNPIPGWVFAGWKGALAGQSLPATITLNGEVHATALFNTTAEPLAVTGVQPAAIPAGTANRTLTILGTGFTPSTAVIINNAYRQVTYLSSSRLTVKIKANELTTPGTFPVSVINVVGGFINADNCYSAVGTVFSVASP